MAYLCIVYLWIQQFRVEWEENEGNGGQSSNPNYMPFKAGDKINILKIITPQPPPHQT